MDYPGYGSTDNETLALILGVYLGGLLIGLAIGLVFYVITAIAMSKLFTKVGIEGWIAWVPFYNTWKLLELGGQPGWISLAPLVGLSIVSSVFTYIGMWRTGIAFGKGAGTLVLGIFFPFAWAFILSNDSEVYRPELTTQAGYPPPLAGYGSVRPA